MAWDFFNLKFTLVTVTDVGGYLCCTHLNEAYKSKGIEGVGWYSGITIDFYLELLCQIFAGITGCPGLWFFSIPLTDSGTVLRWAMTIAFQIFFSLSIILPFAMPLCSLVVNSITK